MHAKAALQAHEQRGAGRASRPWEAHRCQKKILRCVRQSWRQFLGDTLPIQLRRWRMLGGRPVAVFVSA